MLVAFGVRNSGSDVAFQRLIIRRVFQDKVGFHFGKKLVHHRRLLSLTAGRSGAFLLQYLDGFGQNELAVQALGCDETDLTGLRKALVQTLEGNTQAVADPVVVEVAESNGLS